MTFKEFFFNLSGWVGVALVVWMFSAIIGVGIYDYLKQKQERKVKQLEVLKCHMHTGDGKRIFAAKELNSKNTPQ